MLLYPEVLRKAREELDRVIGRGRLPDFTDRDSLPYITAIAKETLRYCRAITQYCFHHDSNILNQGGTLSRL